jgi:MbtH protein
MFQEDEDTLPHVVVIDDEERYSIWLAGKPIPAGWHRLEKSGTKRECLEYVSNVWTDMRPLSLRRNAAAPQG